MMDRMTARACSGDAAGQDLQDRLQTRFIFGYAEQLFSANRLNRRQVGRQAGQRRLQCSAFDLAAITTGNKDNVARTGGAAHLAHPV